MSQIDEGADYLGMPMVQFIEEVLGERLWSRQREIVQAVDDHEYVSIASGHGVGKSYIMALIVLAFIHTRRESIVLTTAPTNVQVEHVLWEYIRAAYGRNEYRLMGRMLTKEYKIRAGWYALGFKPSDRETDRLQGFHAENILTIIDEAAGVPDKMIDVLQATMTSSGAHFVMVGNPTSVSGRFRESHHGNRDVYHTISIPVQESPNFTMEFGEAVPGLVTPRFVEDEIKLHGLESDYIQARVFAKWPKGSANTLIPVSDLEAALARGQDEVSWVNHPYEAGFDAARFGADASVLTVRQGGWVHGQWAWLKQDTQYSTGQIRAILEEYGGRECRIKGDAGNMGGAIMDSLRAEGYDAVDVNFGAKSSDSEQWPILRHELYWIIAQTLREQEIGGDIGEDAVAQLSDVRFTYDQRHTKPIIERKDAIKERTGRSPDHAESLMLAFYDAPYDPMFGVGSAVSVASRNPSRRRRGRR